MHSNFTECFLLAPPSGQPCISASNLFSCWMLSAGATSDLTVASLGRSDGESHETHSVLCCYTAIPNRCALCSPALEQCSILLHLTSPSAAVYTAAVGADLLVLVCSTCAACLCSIYTISGPALVVAHLSSRRNCAGPPAALAFDSCSSTGPCSSSCVCRSLSSRQHLLLMWKEGSFRPVTHRLRLLANGGSSTLVACPNQPFQ